MNKIEIEVPRNIRYISDWPDFPLQQLSTGHCIVNKTITGCGYTHFCLTNDQNVILCSPRKFLLENKHEQLGNTYLVINSGERCLDVDGDEKQVSINNSVLENYSIIQNIEDDLRNYVLTCQISNIPPKILVTYDSLKYVLNALGDSISFYSVIVDEFQNIFMDSRFKAETELNFIDVLQSCPNVTYLSATPYIKEYLDELDEFKNLPYYEFKWHPDRLQTIKIDPKKVFRPNQEIDRIIQDYLEGKFPEKIDEETGEIHQSREIVFYMNSVRMIISTIKRNNLEPDQVNIICADTDKNKSVLRKYKKLEVGKAPLKGQPHKMFTFCTRTTYAGADFYSTSAISVIVSDCKIDSLATDIRMDFPQIMGRQRLKENVFRDECIFIYKLSDETITLDEYDRISKVKLERSQIDLDNFMSAKTSTHQNQLLEDFRDRVSRHKYTKDYTGIQEKTGKPVINKLVMISERRAFELRSDVYKSDVQVYNEFANLSIELSNELIVERNNEIVFQRSLFNSNGLFETKMRAICEFLLNPKWYGHVHVSDLGWLPLNMRNYLIQLGPKRIKELGCREIDIKREISNNSLDNNLVVELSKEFKVGERYQLKDIKRILTELYNKLNITKTPKAVDLEEYFVVKSVKIYNTETKKQSKGYEIIKLIE
jgi:hypothetical protein